MLLVRTKIGPSTIHGTGLFADQFIPKGTVIWRFVSGVDLSLSDEVLATWPDVAREWYIDHAHLNETTGTRTLCFDNDRFINHSENPNIGDVFDGSDAEGVSVALRDISPGEELTCNYFTFDASAREKLGP